MDYINTYIKILIILSELPNKNYINYILCKITNHNFCPLNYCSKEEEKKPDTGDKLQIGYKSIMRTDQ